MDALEALGRTARTPSSVVPLAAQSREEPVPYSLAGKDHQFAAFLFVAHGGVVDEHPLARRLVNGEAAFHDGAVLIFTIWFVMRMLANVPRIMTSWLPRRAVELNSDCGTPCSVVGLRGSPS